MAENKYLVTGSPGSYVVTPVEEGSKDYESGMSEQAAQETADSLNAAARGEGSSDIGGVTKYWGRYDSGSWALASMADDGSPDVDPDLGFTWAWKLGEFDGTSQEDFTAEKTLNDILGQVTDDASIGGQMPGSPGPVDDGPVGFQNSQVWVVGENKFVAFKVPDTEMWIRYSASDELLDQYYSSGRERPEDRVVSEEDEVWIDSNSFGDLSEVDEDILLGSKDPLTGLADKWQVAKKYRPWLADDELRAVWTEAFIEDRDVLDEEWKTTEWWRTHTKEQRDWLLLSQGQDLSTLPADAKAYLNNNVVKIRAMFKAAGVDNIDSILNNEGESFLDWFSFQFTEGNWTEVETADQIKGLGDASLGIERKEEIGDWLSGKAEGVDISSTKLYEAEVQNLANEWLGPLYGLLTPEKKEELAGIIRNSEDPSVGQGIVNDRLKAMRGTLFGDYDENLTYNDIATPWRNYSAKLLGQSMDETDSTFIDVIKANDQKEATMLLTEWGINNNATTLIDKVTDEIGQSVGAGAIVRGFGT